MPDLSELAGVLPPVELEQTRRYWMPHLAQHPVALTPPGLKGEYLLLFSEPDLAGLFVTQLQLSGMPGPGSLEVLSGQEARYLAQDYDKGLILYPEAGLGLHVVVFEAGTF